jgi:peptide/nickel transport system substrate-binding protein
MLLDAAPHSLNVHEESDLSSLWPMMPVYDSLLRYAPLQLPESPTSIEPALAESWQLGEDGLSFKLLLRNEVRWHDGEPFTSLDVRFTLRMLMSGQGLQVNPRQGWYSNVVSIETPNSREVTIRLARPQPSLLAMLASGVAVIYPAHIAEADPGVMRQRALGTGPFKLRTYDVAGGVITLLRNPDYYIIGLPYLDQIDYIIASPAIDKAMLEAGLVEMSAPLDLTRQDVAAIQVKNSSLVLKEVTSSTRLQLLFNHGRSPWSDVNVRSAISLALNRSAYTTASDGRLTVGGPLMPGGIWALPGAELQKLPGYGSDAKADLERAMVLLTKAGQAGGLTATLVVQKGRLVNDAVYVRTALTVAGIDVKVTEVEPELWSGVLQKGDFDLAIERVFTLVDDMDASYFPHYACGATWNLSGYCSQLVEGLALVQSAEQNVGLRLKDVRLLQQRLVEDVADVVLGWEVNRMLLSPRVRAWELHPTLVNNARMQEVWLAPPSGR